MNIRIFMFDLRRLIREPILLLLMLVPIIALIVIRLAISLGSPALQKYTGFDMNPYRGYVEVFAVLFPPFMLGTVMAFLMIDERDEKIYELMSVTPLGFTGYITNRLMVTFALSVIYTYLCHYLIGIYSVPASRLVVAALFAGFQSIVVGLFLFSVADDKVKGLTYAKGLNAFMLTAFADLFGINWFAALSAMFPFYWTQYIITKPLEPLHVCAAFLVHFIWLGLSLEIVLKRR